MELACRLDQLIEIKGVTLYQVSKATGISQATLGRVMCNKTKKLNTKNFEILAKYFDVRETWLRTGKGESEIIHPELQEEQKVLKFQETISKLILQNEKLVSVIEKQSATIKKSIETINALQMR
ncbi:MAG: helix-turn-helix transcriptional regulator [Bacteroidota bacterium]